MLRKDMSIKKFPGKVLVLTVLLSFAMLFVTANIAYAGGTTLIDTIVGTGSVGYSGDGGQATDASFNYIYDFVFDSSGNMYLTDTNNNVIRKVDTSGVVTTIAGTGVAGYSGDGGLATSAQLYQPSAITIDDSGNLYVSDSYNHVVRKIDTSGIITTIAGTGVAEYSGDGGLATEAGLNLPFGLCFDNQGNLLIADTGNCRLRKVDMTTGILTTIAGDGGNSYSGEGGLATDAGINSPTDVVVDSAGNIFLANNLGHRVLRIDATTGIINTYAGNGTGASTVGVATESSINRPWGLAFDDNENLYIVERNGSVISKVNKSTGILSRVAGTGSRGFTGDGGDPLDATFNFPSNVEIDNNGIIYIADKTNNRIREIATYYSASYTAGSNGSLTGTTSQTIKANTNGTEVVAVPDSGYGFVQWSNGVKTSSRTDKNVTSDINVTAQFDVNYTITLNEQGGDPVDDIIKVNNSTIESAPSITKAGYNFDGWYAEDTYDTAIVFPYTVTGNDAWYAKWSKVETPTPTSTSTVTPPTVTSTPKAQTIGITGTLRDQDGNPLSGYFVEIHSTPQVVVTDDNGTFSFTNVSYGTHTLIVKDADGTTLSSFKLTITQGSKFDWESEKTNIGVTVTDNTVSLSFDIGVSEDGNVSIDDIKEIVNPQTGSEDSFWWFVLLAGSITAVAVRVISVRVKRLQG